MRRNFLVIVFILSRLAGATTDPDCIVPLVRRPDVAMEIEVRVRARETRAWQSDTRQIMDLMTTTTGRVDALLDDRQIERLPADLRASLPAIHPSRFKFDLLTERQRHGLVAASIEQRGLSFAKSRVVPGLELKSIVTLRWNSPRLFLGQLFEAHRDHVVDISPLLHSRAVEVDDVQSHAFAGLFEIHFRSNRFTPAQLQTEVWTLLEGLGIGKDKAHVHVVVPLTRDRLKDPAEQFGLLNTFRLANLAAEMFSIVHKGLSIKSSNLADWDSLTGEKLVGLARDLRIYVESGMMPHADRYKMSYVGFHFPNKYDGEDGIGFHFRSVDRRYDAIFGRVTHGAQRALLSSSLIGARDRRWWTTHRQERHLHEVMRTLWYRPSLGNLNLVLAPGWIRETLSNTSAADDLARALKINFEARMLIYDWENDPIFFEDAAAAGRMRLCQQLALDELKRFGRYSTGLTRELLRCGRAFERVLDLIDPPSP